MKRKKFDAEKLYEDTKGPGEVYKGKKKEVRKDEDDVTEEDREDETAEVGDDELAQEESQGSNQDARDDEIDDD